MSFRPLSEEYKKIVDILEDKKSNDENKIDAIVEFYENFKNAAEILGENYSLLVHKTATPTNQAVFGMAYLFVKEWQDVNKRTKEMEKFFLDNSVDIVKNVALKTSDLLKVIDQEVQTVEIKDYVEGYEKKTKVDLEKSDEESEDMDEDLFLTPK